MLVVLFMTFPIITGILTLMHTHRDKYVTKREGSITKIQAQSITPTKKVMLLSRFVCLLVCNII